MKTLLKKMFCFRQKQPKYVKEYQAIKKRCKFQIHFSGCLLVIFFLLQYSVPILLVVLGSIASSREQLSIFFEESEFHSAVEPNKTTPDSQEIISKIIYLVGLITILLGVVNNIVRPPESYDIASHYNNKFLRFGQNLDLEFIEISDSSGKFVHDEYAVKIIIKFLIAKNDELSQLIQEYNDARSLSPRQTHLQDLSKNENKDKSEDEPDNSENG